MPPIMPILLLVALAPSEPTADDLEQWGAEALVEVRDDEGAPPYAPLVARAMGFVHASVRDAEGRNASDWGRPLEGPVTTVRLIDQASAARGFYVAPRALR